MELPNLTQTDQANGPNSNNLRVLQGSGRRVSHRPKLMHEDTLHELIDADNSCFYSPHSRLHRGDQENLYASILRGDMEAAESRLIEKYLGKKPMINNVRAIAARGSTDSRR